MAKYKVEWSVESRSDLLYILEYYCQRNGSADFSRKLSSKINKSLKLVTKNPLLGIKTDIITVRALVTNENSENV